MRAEKDESIAHGDEPVHGGGIGHLRERVPGADTERGHGQDCRHACSTTRRGQKIKSCYGKTKKHQSKCCIRK